MFPCEHNLISMVRRVRVPEPKTANYPTFHSDLSGLLDLAGAKPPSDEGGGKTGGFDGGRDNEKVTTPPSHFVRQLP